MVKLNAVNEVVPEDVRTWAIFPEISRLLGEEDAKVQLERIYNESDCATLQFDAEGLGRFISWKSTPQGSSYWIGVLRGNDS